jgi:hypothetical protein
VLSDLIELGADVKLSLDGRPASAFSFNGCLLLEIKLMSGEIIF